MVALQESRGFPEHELIVVIDGDWPKTREVITRAATPSFLIETSRDPGSRPRNRILKNLHIGLELAFGPMQAPYCVVVEDDILVADDFLEFVGATYAKFNRNSKFRAVNGFSRLPPSVDHKPEAYVRLNYGVGWGWALPRNSFKQVQKLLLRDGDYHWDSLVEPFMRTGFVVNPVRSRVMNIGFDGSGSHSGTEADREIGEEMARSILAKGEWSSTRDNLVPATLKSNWRRDAISLDRVNPLLRSFAYVSGFVMLWLESAAYLSGRRDLKSSELLFRRARKSLHNRVTAFFESLEDARN